MSKENEIKITRIRLYDRIWDESVAQVGRSFGVWGTRLARICATNNIPVPNKLHWNYSEEERRKRKLALPQPQKDWEISFTRSIPGPMKKKQEMKTYKVTVPRELRNPHPLVVVSNEVLDKQKIHNFPKSIPDIDSLDIHVSQQQVNRALKIMDTLLKASEKRGWRIKANYETQQCPVINVDDCQIRIKIEEALRQQTREPDTWEARQKRKRPPYDLIPTGRLRLIIKSETGKHQKKWEDGKKQQIEDRLTRAIDSFEEIRDAWRIWRRELDEHEEKRRKKQQLRLEKERMYNREKQRVDTLVADATAWQQSNRIRRYIDAWVKNKEEQTGRKIEIGSFDDCWIKWALCQAAKIDPLSPSPASILDMP